MLINATLSAKGYRGEPDPPPFTYELTSDKNYKTLLKTGGISNVITLGNADDNAALILAYKNSFPSAQNATSQYSGSSTYLSAIPAAFGGNVPALAHERNQNGTTSSYLSVFTFAQNSPFSLRVFVYKAVKEITTPILQFRFGAWLFRIVDGNPEIALTKPTWTQTAQSALDTLLAAEGHNSAIDSQRAALYDIYESLGSSGVSLKQGEFYEITFIPEPRGALNIGIDNKWHRVLVPSIIETGKAGILYPTSRLAVRGNGIQYMWQFGYPLFTTTGTLSYRFKDWHMAFDNSPTPLSKMVKLMSYTSASAGTTATGTMSSVNSVIKQATVTLNTSNTRYTPFVYSAQILMEAGEAKHKNSEGLVMHNTPIWTSSNYGSCIEDVEIEWEGEEFRRQARVTIIDTNGTKLDLGMNYDLLDNRLADLTIGGSPFMTDALVKESTGLSRRAGTEGQSASYVTLPESKVTPLLVDGWQFLEEDEMLDDPIVDGMKLSDAIRLILRLGGWSTSSIFGIPIGAGRILPKAALGDPPALRMGGGTRADALRRLIQRWGLGLSLYQGVDGIWYLANTSSGNVLEVGGVPCHFKRNSVQALNMKTYPGRLAILREYDVVREYGEVYNSFYVSGRANAKGEVPSAWWNIFEGYRANYDAGTGISFNKKHIGRIKRYPRVEDEGIRNAQDALYVLRSLVEKYGGTGRFHAFDTFFHKDLYPGAKVLFDDIPCRVKRISGGSIKQDKMSLVLQELT